MDYLPLVLFLGGFVLIVLVHLVRNAMLAEVPKRPAPEPAHVWQSAWMERAFPVGVSFNYLGFVMYPFRYSRHIYAADDCLIRTVAELRCEYNSADGYIRQHVLSYEQAMAIDAARRE